MKKNKNKLSCIVPSYNEEGCINKLLTNLTKFLIKNKIDYEIIVVDDNSQDNTIKIVKKFSSKNRRIKLMIRKNKRGFGSALVDGSKQASGDIICWIMADLSDDFKAIPKMIKEINNEYDMVIGSRNIRGGSRGDQGKLKAIGSTQFSYLAKLLFKLPVYDITNAFRAFKKELILKISLENNKFAISPEFALRTHVAGYRLQEIPVIYKDRNIGEAKTKLFSMGFFYYKMLIKYWFQNLIGKFKVNP